MSSTSREWVSICQTAKGRNLSRLSNIQGTNSSRNGLRDEAERDKSRPFRFHPTCFIAIMCLPYTNNKNLIPNYRNDVGWTWNILLYKPISVSLTFFSLSGFIILYI